MSALITAQLGDFPNSKLGNGLFRLLFLHMLKDERGIDVRLAHAPQSPVALLRSEGDFPDPTGEDAVRFAFHFDDGSRIAGPDPDMDEIEAFAGQQGGAPIDIYGFFQYHTGHLRRGGRPLLTVHIRRGDDVEHEANGWNPLFFGASIAAVTAQVHCTIAATGSGDMLVYLCSDDLPYCIDAFRRAGLQPLSHLDLLPQDPPPHNADSVLLLDMAMMVRADFLIAANSSLSVFAALLNETGKVFLRPDPAGDGLVPFHPWNTPVLLARQRASP